jgi:hypothetical protein
MSHRSRLCAVLVDCPESSFDQAVTFWSGALGRPAIPPETADARYSHLETSSEQPIDVLLQRVPDAESALHLDIETDDVEAEVARLVRLGATRKAQIKSWWVLADPAGHPFCVVPVQSKDWPKGAVEWPHSA